MNLTVKAFISRIMTSPVKSIITIVSVVLGLMVVILCTNVNYKLNELIQRNHTSQIVSVHSGKESNGSINFESELPYNDSVLENIITDIPEIKSFDKLRELANIFSYNDELYKTDLIIETESSFIINHDLEILSGRNITDSKTENYEAIISDKISEELFYNESPIGKTIELKSSIYNDDGDEEIKYFPYEIVGTYKTPERFTIEQKGIPQVIFSINNINENVLLTFIVQTDKVEALKNKIEEYLKLELGQDRSFIVWSGNIVNNWDDFSWLDKAYNMMKIFFNILGGITLLVLCFSIFSMVMVSTSERTREIGLKRALGFSKIRVVKQSFIESLIFISIGIFPGLLLSSIFFPSVLDGTLKSLAGDIIDFSELVTYKLSLKPVITAILVTLFSGSILGLYPAITSVNNMPIESIKEN